MLPVVCAIVLSASLPAQTADDAAILAALDREPLPQELVVRAKALSFPDPARPGLVVVAAEIAGGEFRYDLDKAKGYRAEAAVLVRFRDGAGRTVQTVTEHYPRSGPITELDAARGKPVEFYRETELPAGAYTVDLAAYDALARTAGVQRTRLEVPATSDAGRLRLSTLMLVKTLERVPQSEHRPDDPLTCDDLVIHPNLDEPVSRSADKQLLYFLTAYQRKEAPRPKATVEILHEGHRLAQFPVTLSPPDTRGRIQHLGGLNLAALGAGTYELRIMVSDNQSLQSRSTSFTVVD